MIIRTTKNGLIIDNEKGLMPVEIQSGSCPGYSDVLHFYFYPGCEIAWGKGHIIIKRPKSAGWCTKCDLCCQCYLDADGVPIEGQPACMRITKKKEQQDENL